MSKQHPNIGIDLGTTYSLISVFVDGAPRVISTQSGTALLPSVVGLDGDRVLVGESARVRAVTTPDRVQSMFKRDMGTKKVYDLGTRQKWSPIECSALVLKELRAIAEQELGTKIERAVISVPAYFGERQRNATKAAAKLAGLEVLRLINEPTAAALAYGLHQAHREFKAVVLDLGGGTFDVTVLEMLEGVIEVQAAAGDVQLGGEDFLTALYDLMRTKLPKPDKLTAQDAARLRAQLENAKRELSQQQEVPFEYATLTGTQTLKTLLTQDLANSTWAPLLARMRSPIQRALRDARTSIEQVNQVLLVGGATRMPCVLNLARELFGAEPAHELPPDEAVALGAAVQAALINNDSAVREVVMTDIAPFTLGIETGNKFGHHAVYGLFMPIVERGTLLPASRSHLIQPLDDDQDSIRLKVYQGEHSDCTRNTLLGTLEVRGIPLAAEANRSVEVRFTYDLSGVLDVDCTVLATKQRARCVLDQSGQLSAAELDAIQQRLQALKFHPREALPNVTLLGKADALFAELTGVERSELGAAIAKFRTLLETQDPAAIARGRTLLTELVQRLERPKRLLH